MSPHILMQPAEGDRDIVERELKRQTEAKPVASDRPAQARPATADDVSRLMGETEATKIAAILALRPSLAELEQAWAWTQGDGDTLGKEGRPLSGKVAELFEILRADFDERTPAPEEP